MHRRHNALLLAALLTLGGLTGPVGHPTPAAADYLTNSASNARDGVTPGITAITPASVKSSNFGLLYSTPVDGQVYAQPLIYQGVAYVATLDDDIYAINSATGQVLWEKNYGTPVPNACSDISAPQGIVATPVVDPGTNTLYFTSKTWDGSTSASIEWQLNAIDLNTANGAEKPGWPIAINGDASNDPTDPFTPASLLQRPGLLLNAGYLFLGFGSYCDTQPYQGWIADISATATPSLHLYTTEANTPGSTTNSEGSVWQSGTGLAADASGDIYIVTGNGTPPPVGPGTTPAAALGETVVRFHLQADGTIAQVDHFAPQNAAFLNTYDYDFGSGGPALLPDNFANIPGKPHLLAVAGKLGDIYLLNRDDLGGVTATGTPDNAVGELLTGDYNQNNWVFGHPTDLTVNGVASLYFVGTYKPLTRYTVSSAGAIAAAGATTVTFPFGSSSPTLSWDGSTPSSAVIWVIRIQSTGKAPTLYAISPTPSAGVLPVLNSWTSPTWTAATKFNTPVVDGTRVYVGTNDGHLLAFGGLPTAPLNLTATPADGSVTLNWQPPASNGGPAVTSYTASISGTATSQTIPATSPLTATFSLPDYTSNTFTVVANNPNGAGPPATTPTIITAPPPVVTSLSPAAGSFNGGTSVLITGANFASPNPIPVKIQIGSKLLTAACPGGGTAGCFTVDSNTQITLVTPAAPSSIVPVQVITAQSSSALNSGDLYTYFNPSQLPTVSSLTPSVGPISGGQVVTVTGTNFTATMTVTIGGIGVTPVSATTSSFSFTTPAVAATYTHLQVTTVVGSSALSPASGYLFSPLGSYVPLTPFRILDTRSNDCVQCSPGPLGPGQVRTLPLTGVTGLGIGSDPIPSSATAVVLNVTAVAGTTSSLLTLYPSGTARPLASNLNFPPGTAQANLATVALGQNQTVNIYNALGTVNVVVDVEGYFAPAAASLPAGEYHPLAPLRACDTRAHQPANPCNQNGTAAQDELVGPAAILKVNLANAVPSDGSTEAAVFNLTAISGSAPTFISAFPTSPSGTCAIPGGGRGPAFSTLNLAAGRAQANRVMVALGPDSSGSSSTAFCLYNAAGWVDLIVDVNGWYGSASAVLGAQYQTIGPTRICDTRSGSGQPCAGHLLTKNATLLIPVAGVKGIPPIASNPPPVAVIGNLTAVAGSLGTYLTLYPANLTFKPNISDLNALPGEVLPNLVVVGLDPASGAAKLYNALGNENAVLDIEGWFQ